ncbi:MAG: SGNH/GDSL hydrolase family protein [Isosphaerales bacterium]
MGKPLLRFQRVLVFLRTGWSILGITLVVLLLAEAGFRVIFAVRDRSAAEPAPDRRVLVEGYGGDTWPVEHYRELGQLEERWQPYVYFRPKPFEGSTIRVGSDGLRTTWQPPANRDDRPQPESVKVLMLGGSSLWGFGARDDRTIPSLLARALDERGQRVELKNLSGIGYVSTQELIALLRELQAGYRPDVVIFYDGVNDTTSAFLGGEAGLTTNESNRRDEFNLLQSPARLAATLTAKLVKDSGSYRFARAVRRRFEGGTTAANAAPSDETLRRLARDVAARYAANIGIVESLSRGYGFRPLFFWQPIVFTKHAMVQVEREEAQRYAWTEQLFRAVYGRIQASPELKTDPAFQDLSGIFDGTEGLVFIDYCHTTESANARIAVVMADRVLEGLRPIEPAATKQP